MSTPQSIDSLAAGRAPVLGRPPALACYGIGKQYGGTWAVHPLDLEITAGHVHALVGENGAGKSTLLGLISGRVEPSAGSVEINGERTHGGSAREAQRHGISVVYQEMTLIPALSAIDNVFLGTSSTLFGFVNYRPMRAAFRRLCEMFQVTIQPDALVSDLPIAQQQMLEIFRGVEAGARILVLDEPSAALAEFERMRLHEVIRQLRDSGVTVLIVSHNLDEVLELSDDITVLRNGSLVRTAPRMEWDRRSLIQSMVGRAVETERYRRSAPVSPEPRMLVSHVSVPGTLDDITLEVGAGEVVGLWGLIGSGRTTFMRSIVGLERRSSGTLVINGQPVSWNKSVRQAGARGIVMVPEDRRTALLMPMTGSTNVCIGTGETAIVRPKHEQKRAASASTFFGFSPERIASPVGSLSGGNQQKVLLTKWAHREPQVMLIDEPTRGIDIGAKAEVLASLVALAERGTAIVVTSSDLEEVLAVCDRILVFNKGAIADVIQSTDPRFSVDEIVRIGFEQKEQTT